MEILSKLQTAVIKRTAQNVAQFVNKKAKIDAKIAELEAEKASIQPIIDSFQGPIKKMTGGYTTEDLVTREVVHTGKFDAKGKEIMQTRYVFKYPETIIPCSEAAECQNADNVNGAGSDYDFDKEAMKEETIYREEVEQPYDSVTDDWQ